MKHNQIRIAAAIIVDAQGQTLLVRKSGTLFFMQPGGKIDENESAVQALIRELQEELELATNADELQPLGTYKAIAANENDHEVVADLFLLVRSIVPQPANEIVEAIWLSPEAARTKTLAPLTRHHVLPILETLKPDPQ